jgi:hypothetical protein
MMSELVTISSVTGNSPFDIYYCDLSGACTFVSGVTVFPFSFIVPPPNSDTDFVIKIIDAAGCIVERGINITPTPTTSLTPTITPSSSLTPTPTIKQTITLTPTHTPTPTVTQTPTITPTPSTASLVSTHYVGINSYPTSNGACGDAITLLQYYTYIAEADLVPVVGATVYQTLASGLLYNPVSGGNNYIKMVWNGIYNYAVQIDPSGKIIDFVYCLSLSAIITENGTIIITETLDTLITE